jgi:hypothetical protein
MIVVDPGQQFGKARALIAGGLPWRSEFEGPEMFNLLRVKAHFPDRFTRVQVVLLID